MISTERYTIDIAKIYEGMRERDFTRDEAKAVIRGRLLMEMGLALGITPESEEGSDLLLDAYETAREVFNKEKAEGIAWTLREAWEQRMLQDAA